MRSFSDSSGEANTSNLSATVPKTEGQRAILLVSDDPALRFHLLTCLELQNYRVLEAADAAEALAAIHTGQLGLTVLDLDLPEGTAYDIIKRVRQGGSKLPIIVLLNSRDKRAKMRAFAVGADDYLMRPYPPHELLPRVRAAIRNPEDMSSFTSGYLTVDLMRGIVTLAGTAVNLSPTEHAILRLLVLSAGKVRTYSSLVREVWGATGEVQYLRIYVQHLREKLETDPRHPTLIITETGVGYRLLASDVR